MVWLASAFYIMHIKYGSVYHMYKLQFQTQFCYFMIAYGVTYRNSSMYTVCSNSLLYFLQTMLILYVHACTVEYLYVACELSDNGQ